MDKCLIYSQLNLIPISGLEKSLVYETLSIGLVWISVLLYSQLNLIWFGKVFGRKLIPRSGLEKCLVEMNQAGIVSAKTYLNADGELDLTLNSG